MDAKYISTNISIRLINKIGQVLRTNNYSHLVASCFWLGRKGEWSCGVCLIM